MDLTQALLVLLILLAAAVLVLQVVAFRDRDAGARDAESVRTGLAALAEAQDKAADEAREDARAARTEDAERARGLRLELAAAVKGSLDSMLKAQGDAGDQQGRRLDAFAAQLTAFAQTLDQRLETVRGVVDQRLKSLQDDNAKKLDQMRQTVDEKLQGTLEKRLGESFRLVSERLESVQKGLGEMQTLASGVGDLKKVLTNVKTRGTWGEVQLGNLLEQMLTREQFDTNVATKPGSSERVEFAVRLPGPDGPGSPPIWLPIDSKCPVEDYQRLVEAAERGDADAVRESSRQLEIRLKACAKSIAEKYVAPPHTTNFAVLFVPTEGLYAEALRLPGLSDVLQREHRVTLAGPTTLTAMLSTFQMGFRTLAIQQRSGEVWKVLAAVKTEFTKFGDVFDKVQKKLGEATNTIDEASRRTRAMQKSLRTVEELPAAEASGLLGLRKSEDPLDGDLVER
jgi:DNA recombination protein RmuC